MVREVYISWDSDDPIPVELQRRVWDHEEPFDEPIEFERATRQKLKRQTALEADRKPRRAA